jgi:ABC-type polysaccharide/polyol phosphate export permease
MDEIIKRIQKHSFMFEELVKRDFKQKYKRTVLGMVWSILNPLLTLLVMRVVLVSEPTEEHKASAMASNASRFST